MTTLYLDTEKGRIVCNWCELTEYIMDKRPVVIPRSRRIWARVTKSGIVRKNDTERCRSHPKFKMILRFSRELQDKGVLARQKPEPCAVCGTTHGSLPCFDPRKMRMVWMCREHLDEFIAKGLCVQRSQRGEHEQDQA